MSLQRRKPLGPGRRAEKRGSTFAAERKPLARTADLEPVSRRRVEREARSGRRPRRGNSNSTMSKQGSGFAPASPEQRAAVEGERCVICGAPDVDPAHLTSRANPHGERGCDHPLCVVPLCRRCHDIFDGRIPGLHKLDLAEVLALPEYAAHRAHMALHMTFPMALQRLTGARWRPVEAAITIPTEEVPDGARHA